MRQTKKREMMDFIYRNRKVWPWGVIADNAVRIGLNLEHGVDGEQLTVSQTQSRLDQLCESRLRNDPDEGPLMRWKNEDKTMHTGQYAIRWTDDSVWYHECAVEDAYPTISNRFKIVKRCETQDHFVVNSNDAIVVAGVKRETGNFTVAADAVKFFDGQTYDSVRYVFPDKKKGWRIVDISVVAAADTLRMTKGEMHVVRRTVGDKL